MSDETSHNFAYFPTLTPTQRVYVLARARGKSVSDAAELASVTRRAPLNWDADLINAAILEVQQSMITGPAAAFTPLLPKALGALEAALDDDSLDAAKEVFNRLWGKPVQRTENQNWDMSQFTLPELDRLAAGDDPKQVLKDRGQ